MPPLLKPVKYVLILVGLVTILAASVVVWNRSSADDPSTTFWKAFQANLTSKAATCDITDTNSGTTTIQTITLDLADASKVRATTDVKTASSTVNTEEIDNGRDVYVRYTGFKTSQAGFAASGYDFSKVLNTWTRSERSKDAPSLFGRTALGNCVLPLASVSADQARSLTDMFRTTKAITGDFSNAPSQTSRSGEAVYVYKVTVQPRPYVAAMKAVAKAYGLAELDSVSQATYQAKEQTKLTISVAQSDRRVRDIRFDGQQHTINLSNFARKPNITVPTNTISVQELQKRLQVQ